MKYVVMTVVMMLLEMNGDKRESATSVHVPSSDGVHP